MANGIAESFNNWIVAEHSLPPFAMLDQTRMKEMKMMSERSVESKSWTTKLTPKMEKRLKEQLDRSRVFRVIASHKNVYEVRNDKYSYSVDLSTRTCSCVKWQINCFPCAHALAAIHGVRLDVYDFIDPYFTTEYYRMCYSFPIASLSNVDASCSSTEDFILPPVTKRPAGRPKSKRIASAGEKKLIRCGRCNKMGHHNKKRCALHQTMEDRSDIGGLGMIVTHSAAALFQQYRSAKPWWQSLGILVFQMCFLLKLKPFDMVS
ncbi:PREDICTED: uncharacterized protein LOC101301130 [Fragaria vesca subsp. vesca]